MVCRHCGRSVLSDNEDMAGDGDESAFGIDGEVDVESVYEKSRNGSKSGSRQQRGREIGEARWYCWAGEGRLGVCCRGCWVGSTMLGFEQGEGMEERRMGFDGTAEWDADGGGEGRERSGWGGKRERGMGVVRRVREVEGGGGCVVC